MEKLFHEACMMKSGHQRTSNILHFTILRCNPARETLKFRTPTADNVPRIKHSIAGLATIGSDVHERGNDCAHTAEFKSNFTHRFRRSGKMDGRNGSLHIAPMRGRKK